MISAAIILSVIVFGWAALLLWATEPVRFGPDEQGRWRSTDTVDLEGAEK